MRTAGVLWIGPGATDEVSGDSLTLHTGGCGRVCSVDYEVTAPKTVRVAGSTGSGSITVSNVAAAAVSVSSGGLRALAVPVLLRRAYQFVFELPGVPS
jgi:ABC-type branched-subunit amino acid transport system ATPase component